jgi:diguanylate cyclase (GGDEF)-like protein/PAS domain S-box-containing protein
VPGDSEIMKKTIEKLQQQINQIETEKKKIQIQFGSSSKLVKELNEFIQILLNLSPFGICIIQHDKFVFANRVFSEIVGYSSKTLRKLATMDIIFEEDREHVIKSTDAMLQGEAESFFMFRVLTGNETIKWILGAFALIHMNDKRAMVGNFVDITEGRLMELAYSDALTGLANRKLLIDRLGQAIVSAKRRISMLAVLFIDLDAFKQINDRKGHATGDKVLMSVAQRLKEVIRRENDTVARIGGDEFLILLSDLTDRSNIETVIHNIYDSFHEPLVIDHSGLKIKINLSIGVAIFPEHGDSSDKLIHAADMAMYVAKNSPGKNSYHFAESSSSVT